MVADDSTDAVPTSLSLGDSFGQLHNDYTVRGTGQHPIYELSSPVSCPYSLYYRLINYVASQ